MRLSVFIQSLIGRSTISSHEIIGPDPEIHSIHYRATDVRPGGLFVAIPGFRADGHDFIDSAIANGAVAVIAERNLSANVPVVCVSNARRALAIIADCFYGHPSDAMTLVGITGTNGKTTTAALVEHILASAGHVTGLISTIEYHYQGKRVPNPLTTPESADLQRILAEMRDSGVTHVAMEVSSHAIDLHRLENCWFDVGVFTNLTQDHLDFHGSMSAYWESKKKFFLENLRNGPKKALARSIIHCKSAYGRELFEQLSRPDDFPPPVSVGQDGHIRPKRIKMTLSGIDADIETPVGDFTFHSPLVGAYNVENILCGVGVAVALDVPLKTIKAGLESFVSVSGRMEAVANPKGRYIFVDYAHTPDALENVLTTLRALTTGRLICIFGCGGDRDKGKRPIMGRIAHQLADLAVITSDNPRTEIPEKIIKDVVDGLSAGSCYDNPFDPRLIGPTAKGFLVIPDRRQAIRDGIRIARPGDTVLIAGKGHETYQIIGTEKKPFDDRAEAAAALEAIHA